jgi:uncharacterized protein (TIGR03067 family)
MRAFTPLAVVALASAGLLGGGGAQDAGKKDIDRLQGTWTVVSMKYSGKAASPEAVKEMRLVIQGSTYKLTGGDEDYQGKLKVDPSQTPKTIDATFVDDTGTEKGQAQGIYELDGNRLKFCWRDKGEGRPKELESTSGSGVRLLTLEREKK